MMPARHARRALILGATLLSLVLVPLAEAATRHPAKPAKPATAAPAAATPGYFHLPLGNFTVTALYDGYTQIPQGILHGLSEAEITTLLTRASLPTRYTDNLMHDGDPRVPLHTSVNAFLVAMGKNLVLVDTGAAQCFGPTLGKLRDNLRAAGYKPEAITSILLTHLHGDHVCGITDSAGKTVFPNATVWVAKNEADHWLKQNASGNPGAIKLARTALMPYIAAKRFKTFTPGETIIPGLTSIATPGHTPGHTGYLITSLDQRLYIWGDIVHSQAIQLARPEVSLDFDSDQQQAIATRKDVLADTAQKDLLVAGAHLPFPGIGHIRSETDGSYQWIPLKLKPNNENSSQTRNNTQTQ
jgi:glyoxylase-like metal-dependent hydrolase (beta-lactamase superfamily II)